MFDSWYKYSKVGVDKTHHKKYLLEVVTYSFKSPNNYYLVEIEVYIHNIYIVKFYLKKDKQNPLKYHLLTNENRGSRVISTCIRIMFDIFSQNKLASFGFIGANTIQKESGFEEPKQSTKRFKIYKMTMQALFGAETFTHYADNKHSAYLMVNNKSASNTNIQQVAKQMFEDIFPELSE